MTAADVDGAEVTKVGGRWADVEVADSFWRSLQALTATRVVISVVLLIYLSLSNHSMRDYGLVDYGEVCVLYLLLALAFALVSVYFRRRFLSQLMLQVCTDIAVISILYVAASGAKSGMAVAMLYLFPIAGTAILAPLLLALLMASFVTLFLLGESLYQFFIMMVDVPILQAGLFGAVFFAEVLVVNRLASRLIRQEALAARHGRDLQIQLAINRLVVADMGDGILVVGRGSEVSIANPAALRMLGLLEIGGMERRTLNGNPTLQPIADAFFDWDRRGGGLPTGQFGGSAFVTVKPGDELGLNGAAAVWSGRRELVAHLKLRFAKVVADGIDEDRSVIFLQDVTEIENQAQQLKLASMGRLTASIAHEVRNPLSAIGHAAALLAEDVAGPGPTRLLNIIGDNVRRVNLMVESILQLSRRVQANGEPLNLGRFLREVRSEFQETHRLADGMIALEPDCDHLVRFDPIHLHEVVVNLVGNAVRYASGKEGSIRLFTVSEGASRLELHVQDDGPGIPQEVRTHLFEPFYTTSSKGTGLGLYLAREMCLNNGAMLDYEYRIDHRAAGRNEVKGRFVITFAMPESL